MAKSIKLGATATLNVKFNGEGAGRFPRAILLDDNKVPLSESPLDLTFVPSNNTNVYTGTFIMPNTPNVTAETTLYSNAGHTTEVFGANGALDEFELNVSSGEGGGTANAAPDVMVVVDQDETPIQIVVDQDETPIQIQIDEGD